MISSFFFSVALRKIASTLSPKGYFVMYLSDSKLTPRWFYKGMLDQLGIEARFYRGDAKRQLQKEVEIIRGVQKKKQYAFWTGLTFWRRRRLRNSGSC